jgi:serine/threonine protein kinase
MFHRKEIPAVLSALGEQGGTSRFEIKRWVGEGAVGVVYEAFDLERGTTVALKALRAMSADAVLQLKREFRAAQDLQHPNLVSLGELFEDHGEWFFTMELVRGVDFLAYVRHGRASLDETRLRSGLAQLTRGLIALHAAGKLHRDLKPSNVLVTPSGRVVILDFGLARDILGDRGTSEGVVGSIPYLAPEQATRAALGPPADWYAVGVMLYEALAGKLPVSGTSTEILRQKLHSEPQAPSTIVAATPMDLDRLCVELLRSEPSTRPDGHDILRRLHVADSEPLEASAGERATFVGRRAELAALDGAFETVCSGREVSVFVRGESGVGKSALARAFVDRLLMREADANILSSRCYERESVTYKAVDGIIDNLSDLLRGLPIEELDALLPRRLYTLAKAFPVLGRFRTLRRETWREEEVASPHEQRLRLFSTLRELLMRVAERRPLVVIIDDWQWADPDGVILMTEVLRPPNPPPLLFLATQRTRAENGRAAHLTSTAIGDDIRYIDLKTLSSDDAQALSARLLGPDRSNEASIVAEEAGGHPLFIEELARERRTSGARAVVVHIDEALWARASRLAPAERWVLELVAVAGVPIAQQLVATAAHVELGPLFQIASVLRAGRLVRTMGVGRGDTIEPYHDRVRESVLSHLSPEDRKNWHSRLAVALEDSTQPDAEMLATHWQGAGEPTRAAPYAIRAAEEASDALAFDRAARLYRSAIDLGQFGAKQRRALMAKRAEALTNAGRWAEAGEVRLELARGEPDPVEAVDLERLAAEQFLCSGHFDRGVALLRAALEECGIHFPGSPLAVVVYLLFFRLLLRIRGTVFRATAAQANRRTLLRIDTARSAGLGFSMSDNIRGAYFEARCLLLALAAGDPHRAVRALCMEVCFSAAGGTHTRERTARLLASARKFADEVGTPDAQAMFSTSAGYYHYFLGEWREASQWLERAETLFRDKCVGVAFELNSVRLMLYRALAYMGEVEELEARVPPVFREVEKQRDLYSSINLRAVPMMLVGLVQGEAERVEREVGEATKWLASRFLVQHYFCLVAQAQVDLYRRDGARALARMTAAWPAMKRSLLLRVQSIRIAVTDQRARAALAAAAAATDAQRRERLLGRVERDAKRLLAERQGWATAVAEVVRAGVAHLRGDDARCVQSLKAAIAGFDELHMALHAAAACVRLAALVDDAEKAPLRARAEECFERRQVTDASAMVAMLTPGLDS